MNNNRVGKTKNKKIKKNPQKPVKNKKSNKETFSFQDQMIDLISDSSLVQQQPIEDEPKEVQNEKQSQQINQRIMRLSSGEYIVPVSLGKYYKVIISHELQGKAQITPAFEEQMLEINGKQVNTITSYHSFVFQIKNLQKKVIQAKIAKHPKIDSKQLSQFIKGIDQTQETLVMMNLPLKMIDCSPPWAKLPECVNGNDSLMILGQKNTGKSTLAEYLLNIKGEDYALLDCDIGRNCRLQGCVSLISAGHSKMIWIGQLSPLNNLQTYLRGIKYLFNYYRQHLFTRKLIVNTMGYTTGLGELLIYEIYQIVQPQYLLVLQAGTTHPNPNDSLSNILNNFKNGQYSLKLYLNSSTHPPHPSSSSVYYYNNSHASSKKTSCRFEKHFQCVNSPLRNICDLLQLIRQSQSLTNSPQKLHLLARNSIKIYEQSKHGKQELEGVQTVSYRQVEAGESVDMRLVILGKMVKDNQNSRANISTQFPNEVQGLFEALGLGFCFQGYIYSTISISGLLGVVSEGIDFQKKFYHLNQKQLIDLQLRMGRMKYLMVSTKGLGSKGVRNNPSKMLL